MFNLNDNTIFGYRILNNDRTHRGYKYKIRGVNLYPSDLALTRAGFHFFLYPTDALTVMSSPSTQQLWQVEVTKFTLGDLHAEHRICAAKQMRFVKPIAVNAQEVRSINFGPDNSGRGNIGSLNLGHYNVGVCNLGQHNIGNSNIKHFNIGSYNSGQQNIGSMNSGNYNIGDHNSGSFNFGNYNSGIGNLCSSSSGFFNTSPSDLYTFFDEPFRPYYDPYNKLARIALHGLAAKLTNTSIKLNYIKEEFNGLVSSSRLFPVVTLKKLKAWRTNYFKLMEERKDISDFASKAHLRLVGVLDSNNNCISYID